jgi:hypothetical protein
MSESNTSIAMRTFSRVAGVIFGVVLLAVAVYVSRNTGKPANLPVLLTILGVGLAFSFFFGKNFGVAAVLSTVGLIVVGIVVIVTSMT